MLRAFGVTIDARIVRSAYQPGFGCDTVEWNALNYPRNFCKGHLPRYFLLQPICEVLSGAQCVPFWIFEFVSIKGTPGAGGPRASSVGNQNRLGCPLGWMSSMIRSGHYSHSTACLARGSITVSSLITLPNYAPPITPSAILGVINDCGIHPMICNI